MGIGVVARCFCDLSKPRHSTTLNCTFDRAAPTPALAGAIWEGEMAVVFIRKAQALPGKEAEPIKFGAEIGKLVADIVGVEVMVGQQVVGPIGKIAWRATYADMAAEKSP
jgi:hypothetical protein